MTYVLYTVFYIVMSACLIYPPNEFMSAGLTIQSLFSNWLGSENEVFIQYHIRRILVTIICHSLLPLGYLVGLCFFGYENPLKFFEQTGILWQVFVCSAMIIPLCVLYFVWSWWQDNWESHPVSKTLSKFCNRNERWMSVASQINIEFRRIDKICIHTSSIMKLVATDNWIIKVTPYWMNVAHQSDSALILCSSESYQIAPSSPGGAQFLNIEVKSTRNGVKPFFFRLNALDYRDLQDKISRPITILQNVTFHRSLIDKFLDAFREQVAENPVFETLQTESNVKLQKLCVEETDAGRPCNSCHCPPLWCLDCMGKWFASRQDQNETETWLSSKCTCPLCRSVFCMLDVCHVQRRNLEAS
ncbi:E3 ubiquitin-protein ligase TM129 [Blattella germanica]|nr:E3 ubiquitin-protein ligase TM129 [Blattella germanica]